MKNPIVLRDVPPKPKSIKNDFLNPDQRKELKKRLIEKFTKTYGLCNPKLIQDEVESFFAKNEQLNQKMLADLETRIKKAVLKFKSNQGSNANKPQPGQTHNETVAPLEIVEENQNEAVCHARSSKQNLPSDLQEMEDDEWDNVGVYQAYIQKQEKELEKKKRKLEQNAVRAQLDGQVVEKKNKACDKKSEHESYVNMEKQQHVRFLQQQKDTLQMKENEKKELFNMQTKMINARNSQLEKEKQLQDEIDKRIMNSIETDLAKQREIQAARAEAKKKEMIKVREENEARKLKRLEQEENERKEEIELQKLTNELAQDLENQRNAELKAKADKIQQMMLVSDHVVKDQKNKNLEEEKKLLNYVEKKNRLIELKDKRMQMKEKENRLKYREILDLQMKERDEKLKGEREYIREQATLWKQEEEFYSKFNESKTSCQKKTIEEYKKLLEQQILEKEEKKKQLRSLKFPNEQQVKDILLEQIRNLDIQNKILAEHLKC